MAIHLITGVPGAGKSLRAVFQCVQRLGTELEQDRPVFGNVRGFRRQSPLPGSRYQSESGQFAEIDGEWMDCPDGSIIMIDEVQERWRRYRATGEPPPEIAALERHRHRNIDFIITCQNPKQLSDDVRSLVDTHEHLTKKGKTAATVYRWSGRCSTSPYTNRRDADCEVSFWKYPKWIFSGYLSADQHTVRTKIPRVFIIGLCVLVAIPTSLWFAYYQINNVVSSDDKTLTVDQAMQDQGMQTVSAPGPAAESEPESETVTALGGVADPGDDGRCKLYGEHGQFIPTTWEDCKNAFELGFPATVTPISYNF